MKKNLLKITGVLVVLFIAAGIMFTQNRQTEGNYRTKLVGTKKQTANPLSGFVSWESSAENFPHTMEYYILPLNEVFTGRDEFNWTALEEVLEKAKNSGNQAVIRFFLDNPGRESGIPEFLLEDGLETYPYEMDGETGECPDYKNKDLKAALKKFIEEFGKEYDGDPRIGFIQCGLLGFWGEWHTYPYDDWYPDEEAYMTVAQAFEDNFKSTKFMAGEVVDCIADTETGYHDDFFGAETEYFAERLEETQADEKWQTSPVGGEVAPHLQEDLFADSGYKYLKGNADLIRISWCLNNGIDSYSGISKKRAQEISNYLGYDFQASTAQFVKEENGDYILTVNIKNKGIAPFYYPWTIQARVRDANGNEIALEDTDWTLTSIDKLNEEFEFKHTFKNLQLDESKKFDVAIKVINPMENGKNLLFSNKEQDENGWLFLVKKN